MANSGNSHPHLTEWTRNFAKSAGHSTKDILKSVTPNMTSTVINVNDSIRNGRDYLTHTRTGLNFQSKSLETTRMGRSAKDILDSAVNDIKRGNFAHDSINDSLSYLNDEFNLEGEAVDVSNPSSIAMNESKKNAAIIGRAVTQSNMATIDGMKTMTDTLSRVTLKSAEMTSNKLANVTLFGMNRISSDMMKMQSGINTINNNLVAMIRFQNENTSIVNEAALNYYDKSSSMLYEMGRTLADIKDFNDEQKKLSNSKSNRFGRKDDDFLYGGMNFKDYGKFIKRNFDNSIYGMLPMMLGMSGSMMGGKPNLAKMGMDTVIKKLLFPTSVQKSLGGMDKNFNGLIKNTLYKVGDMRDDYSNPLRQFIGEMLGLKRSKIGTANMGNFKKDVMGWNGIAQKTLVEVIPSYLANIESALTRQEKRFYDMDNGVFKTKSQLTTDFMDQYQSKIQYGMTSVTDKITKEINKSNIGKSDSERITKGLNDILNDRISGSKGYDKSYRKEMNDLLNGVLPTKEIHSIMLDLEESIRDTVSAVNEFNSSIENEVGGSAYRNLFNTHGKSQKDLRRKASLFDERQYTTDGRLFSNMTEAEVHEYKERIKAQEALKEKTKKFMGRFRNEKRGARAAGFVDNVSGKMYDADMKIMDLMDDDQSFSSRKAKNVGAATSKQTKRARREEGSGEKKLRSALNRNGGFNFKKAKDAKQSDVDKDMKAGLDIMEDQEPGSTDDKTSIKALIYNLFTGFLKPVTSLFGKNGSIRNFFKSDSMKKGMNTMKAKLFDEKDGLFAPLVSQFKDGIDYLKYAFTGKGYTNRKGKAFKENKNSVLNHLSSGYDFVFKNTMTYLFGDDYKQNESFNKYFKWMDFKGKKDKKTGTSTGETKTSSKMASNVTNPERAFTRLGISQKNVSMMKKNSDPLLLTDNQSSSDKLLPAVQENSLVRSKMENNLIDSTAYVGEKIKSNGDRFSVAVFGDDKESPEKTEKKVKESFLKRLKGNLPKMLTAGIVGAGATMLTGGSVGLLGSLFLPGGPIGGALAGIGLQMLSKSSKFQEFMFGKDDKDGKKTSGLISQKTQAAFKKSLPMVVGAGVLGGMKTILGGSILAASPIGFMASALLPGGVIGGAIMGTGLALLKNNETFNRILFGKSANNPDGHKGILAKGMGKVTSAMAKSMPVIKGGLKGMGTGVIAGATLGNLGLFGSALTMGGPIGAGIAGLGIGIASQTQKFQELLFGTKEIGPDGKLTGKTLKNGLMHQVQNMLSVNVFEPTKIKIEESMTNFAYWAKDKLEYPFRLAFGPIMDSISGLKDSVGDYVKDKFDVLSDGIGKMFNSTIKKIFSPFTKILGKIGGFAIKGVEVAAKATGSIVSAPINMLSMIMAPKRGKEYLKFLRDTLSKGGDTMGVLSQHWQEQEANGEFGTGLKGRAKSFISKFKDVGQAYKAGRDGYNEGMSVLGRNHLNWRGVGADRRESDKGHKDDKAMLKQRKQINKLAQNYAKQDHHKEVAWTDKRFEQRQKELMKLGVDKSTISTRDDLRELMYNFTDWQEKWKPKNAAEIGDLKDGTMFKETPEQEAARKKTEKYQDDTQLWLKEIHDLMLKEANVRVETDRKTAGKKRSEKDLAKFNRKLKKAGLKFEDLGINVEDVVDYNSLPEYAWDEYRDSEYFESGDFTTWYKLYRGKYFTANDSEDGGNNDGPPEAKIPGMGKFNVVPRTAHPRATAGQSIAARNSNDIIDADYVEIPDDNATVSQLLKAQLNVLQLTQQSISKVAAETPNITKAVIQGNEIASDGGFDSAGFFKDDNITDTESEAGLSDTRKRKQKSQLSTLKDFASSFFGKQKKVDEENADVVREADETKKARGLGGKIKSFLGLNKAKTETSDDKEDTKKEGTGLLGKISGMFGSLFNGVTNFFGDSGNWGKYGLAAIIAYGFKDTLGPFVSKLGEKASGLIDKYLEPTLLAIGDFAAKYGPKILEGAAKTITTLMPSLIESAFKIVGSFGTTIINMGKSALGIDADDKHINAEEAAILAAGGANIIDNGDGTYRVLGSRTILDENGNAKAVSNDEAKGRMARLGFNMATNAKTAKAVGKTIVGAATLPLNLLPGGKIVAKTAKAAGNLAVSGIGSGIKALRKTKTVTAAKPIVETAAKVVVNEEDDMLARFTKLAIKNEAVEGTESGAKIVAKTVQNTNISKIGKWFSDFLGKFKKIANNKKITKLIDNKVFNAIVSNLDNLIKKCLPKITGANAGRIAARLADAAQAVIKGGSKLVPVIGWVMIGYDAVTGLMEADKLFGVPSDEVDWGMRTISALMKVILGLGIGPLFDIAIEIMSDISGEDIKQSFATTAYTSLMKLFGNTEAIANLNENQENLKLELANYNEANGTNLSQSAYKDLKNSPWYKKAGNWLTGKKEVDYTQYEEKNYHRTTTTTTTTTDVTTPGYGEGSLPAGYGRGKAKAVGYGSMTAQRQGDSRWANYRLGQFADGSTSTMATGGCGPTALSMVASSLNNNGISPLSVAQFAKSNGYIADGGATADLFTKGAAKLGLSSNPVNGSSLVQSLQNGKPVVISGKSSGQGGSPYTKAGHILTATNLDGNNNVTVSDPENGSSQKINIGKLTNGMTHAWAYSKSIGYGAPKVVNGSAITLVPSNNSTSVPVPVNSSRGNSANFGMPYNVSYMPSIGLKTLDKGVLFNQMSQNMSISKVGDVSKAEILAELANGELGSNYLADNGLYYKNGAPFYQMGDSRWSGIPWASSTMGSKGSDIISLAMALSAYANTGITPDYIYNTWLTNHPEWFSEKTGLLKDIFADGGANSQKETHPDTNARLQITPASSSFAILNAMKNRKLVYMKGYQYNDSIFGGIGSAQAVPTSLTSNLKSVIGTYARNGAVAINDPATDPTSLSIFPEAAIHAKVGQNLNTDAIKEAYIISNPDGTGLSGNIDVNAMKLPESKYKDVAQETTFLGKLGANIGNFASIAENLISSFITGKKYVSIFDKTLAGGDDNYVDYNMAGNGDVATDNTKTSTKSSGKTSAVIPGGAVSGKTSHSSGGAGFGRGPVGFGNGVRDAIRQLFGISSDTTASSITDDGIKPMGYSNNFGDYIGKYVAQFESGTSGPTQVSTGNGDRGGASFGTYQLASYGKPMASGNLKAFWDEYYKNKYPNVTPGENTQFIETWKSEARQNTDAFHANEQAFMGRRYYTPQKNILRGVLDPDNHSRSAQESVWSSAIQYGAQSPVVKKALGGKNSQNVGVKALVNRIQDYKVNNVNSNFASSSASVKAGVRNRHNNGERNVLLNIAGLAPLKVGIGGGNANISTLVSGRGSAKVLGYGTGNADQARQAVAALMRSYTGKLSYSQSGPRNPEKGSADCSSMVAYCYKKVTNINIGGNTGAQIVSINGIDVDSAFTPGAYPNEINLKIGDLLFYHSNKSKYPLGVGHVEMYIGNGQTIGHGGGIGPKIHNMRAYQNGRGKGGYYLKARRFIKDGTDVQIASGSGSISDMLTSASSSGSSAFGFLDAMFSEFGDYQTSLLNAKYGTSIGNGRGPSGSSSNKTPEAWFTNTLGGEVTGKYGLGYGLGSDFHRGIDIGADNGSPIYTPVGGHVIANGNDAVGYGNHVVIRGDDGKNHLFAHLNRQSKYAVGSRVDAKANIGNVGSSGNSTGNHLHYEIRKGDSRYTTIDPSTYTYGSEVAGYGKSGSDKVLYDISTSNQAVSRSQNIKNIANVSSRDDYDMSSSKYGTGGASSNLQTSDVIKKLNVAVNTTGVENKLDVLIDVMKTWAEKEVNNKPTTETKVIAYGNGSKPATPNVTIVNKTESTNRTNYNDMSLRNIHNMVAKGSRG